MQQYGHDQKIRSRRPTPDQERIGQLDQNGVVAQHVHRPDMLGHPADRDVGVLLIVERDPECRAVPPADALDLFHAGIEIKDSHLYLDQPQAGEPPDIGHCHRQRRQVLMAGTALPPHAVQAQRLADGREAQDQQQARQDAVHTVINVRVAGEHRYMGDQDQPFHPARPPAQ